LTWVLTWPRHCEKCNSRPKLDIRLIRVFLAEITRTGKVPVNLKTEADETIAGPRAQRAATSESFYDPTKRLAWRAEWGFNAEMAVAENQPEKTA
jgi:hypothetical protein